MVGGGDCPCGNYMGAIFQNSFHSNIPFTFEEEKDGKIPSFDVLLIRKNDAQLFS